MQNPLLTPNPNLYSMHTRPFPNSGLLEEEKENPHALVLPSHNRGQKEEKSMITRVRRYNTSSVPTKGTEPC
ncbi:hypothetical protein VTL71DRAFT_11867 [Oculimacula yallundae]|uniref:Uncharacterized protein n=1 Tax=Oculimacula yallundae TaxID=86028 RepID=A0ABR4CRN3_9HELO